MNKKIWDPKEDITAYELAICLNFVFASLARTSLATQIEVFDRMSDNAKRHFKDANSKGT